MKEAIDLKAVLRRWAMPQAIGQNGFQLIVVRARNIGLLVHDDAGHRLSLICSKHTAFQLVHVESLLSNDLLNQGNHGS